MKIAIVGSGVSGLTSAYLLSKEHSVHVYEAQDYIGGHVYTLPVYLNGISYEIDTGFIVFNDRTYPNFNKLLKQINKEIIKPLISLLKFLLLLVQQSIHLLNNHIEYVV